MENPTVPEGIPDSSFTLAILAAAVPPVASSPSVLVPISSTFYSSLSSNYS